MRKLLLCALPLLLLAFTTSVMATTCDPITDPACDPNMFISSATSPTSFTSLNASGLPTFSETLSFSSQGADNFFLNNTGAAITDFTITYTGTTGTLSSYQCNDSGLGSLFSSCTVTANTNDVVFYFVGGTIAQGSYFDIFLAGNYKNPGDTTPGTGPFTITPSFTDGGGGGTGGEVPEPASLVLFGSGVAAVAGIGRKRLKRS